MKIINCDQGSPEWHQARSGCITASMFRIARERINCLDEKQSKYVDAILAGKTEGEARMIADYKTPPRAEAIMRAINGEEVGEPSNAAIQYAFRLAVERISGKPLDEGFETYAMRRGHDLEAAALSEHEVQAGVIVQRAGFVTTEDGLFGASADGLIDDDGGCEYKCLIGPDPMRKVLFDNDISEYRDQIQGCMWVTGRRYWHFAMYCPALEPVGKHLYWRHIDRDDDYIEKLEIDLLRFGYMVDEFEKRLRTEAA